MRMLLFTITSNDLLAKILLSVPMILFSVGLAILVPEEGSVLPESRTMIYLIGS